MLQDIAPHRFYNEFDVRKPKDNDYILWYQGNQVILEVITGLEENRGLKGISETEGVVEVSEIPVYAAVKEYFQEIDDCLTYLFSVDDTGFFLLGLKEEAIPAPSSFKVFPIQHFREFEPSWLGFAGITGSQLYRWYRNHQYCGCCGKGTVKSKTERAMVCEQCGVIEYPKISPAVIVGIIDGEKILMTRYANRPFKRYALIAGFVEVGETLEGTVHREVMEEVGVKVKNIRYFDNQPWSFSDSLLVGFFADLDGNNKITLDTEELSEAKWFHRDEMAVEEDHDVSLTYAMMKAFRDGNVTEA